MIPREIREKIECAADKTLEAQAYGNGGFLQPPYNQYRFHNGFIAGAEALLQLLQESAGAEFDKDAVVAEWDRDCAETKSLGGLNQAVRMARWQHDQTKAALAAARAEGHAKWEYATKEYQRWMDNMTNERNRLDLRIAELEDKLGRNDYGTSKVQVQKNYITKLKKQIEELKHQLAKARDKHSKQLELVAADSAAALSRLQRRLDEALEKLK